MLISIITPSYNQAEYLEATLQSVFAQNYPELEYIVVDGGSTDGSVAIIEKYADQLAWWVSEPDRGQADAINKGLRRARGEVVAWLNSDDLYLPGALEAAVAAFHADPDLGMVFGDAITIDPVGRPLNKLAFGNWGLTDLLRFRIICQPAVFMRRSALEQAGYLDENFHFMLDHRLWLRIAGDAKIRHVGQLWAAARHHPAAKNVSQSAGFAEETYRTLAELRADPAFAPLFCADHHRILGGAHRLAGRYLLDGGLPGAALRAYAKALWHWPSYALKHWGRMAFALASLVGWGRLEAWKAAHTAQAHFLPDDPRFAGWPGLNLTLDS
jgi:hypothetical protein